LNAWYCLLPVWEISAMSSPSQEPLEMQNSKKFQPIQTPPEFNFGGVFFS